MYIVKTFAKNPPANIAQKHLIKLRANGLVKM